MTDATRFQFTNPSVPKAYDEFFVPRLFEPWAELLLDEVQLQPGDRVLMLRRGREPSRGSLRNASALPVGSARQTSLSRCWISRGASVIQPTPRRSNYLQSPAAPLAAQSATFDAVLCQQGLQFFPDRPGALLEMRRVLKPNGRIAIAVWAEIERNEIFAAYHAALRATTPSELADLLTARFSWPSGTALKAAVEAAGFQKIRLVTPSLPMVLEGGLEQAVRAFAATPVSPGVAALAQDAQDAFFARIHREMAPLMQGSKVIGTMTSNIIVATC